MTFHLKQGVDIQDLTKLTPNTLILFADFVSFCYRNKLPCVITSLCEDVPGRISSTHREGRAFDASSGGWTDDEIGKCEKYFNEKFKDIAAISYIDNLPRACIYHKVNGWHFHFQARRMELTDEET